MADLVLGLAKSAVRETVNIAKSAIEEERKLQKSVQRDLMLISDEFEMMHSFLNVAKERVADDMTATCMRQVRDMALDVEDCIDSILHLDNKSSWWRHMLPSCMPAATPAVTLKDAVTGIELLKARVEAIGQQNLRYSSIGDSSSKPTNQMQQEGEIHTTASNILPTSTTTREAAKEQICQVELVDLISAKGADVLRVISVLGTVGMASVIKRAYDDPKICKNFRCRAWVKLMHPFNPREFIRSLVAQFCRSYSPQESTTVDFVVDMMAATEEVLIKEFMKQMRFQKYLVVLEGITTMDDWEAATVYLPDSNNGSHIIVSTHQFEIGSLCVGHPHRVLELEKLSSDHSVYALVKEDMVGQIEHQTVWSDNSYEYRLVGREMDVYRLFKLVNSTGVYSVWGMSAVGKSFLVKNFYRERQAEFKNNPGLTRASLLKYGWVNVSHPLDLMDLSWSLLLDLDPGFLQACRMSTMRDPIQECRQYLHKQNCFVVIDGLQSTKEWDLIKDALGLETTRRHVILVITNEESVAKYCATMIELVYNVKGLQVDDTFELLKQIRHPEDTEAQIKEEARHILHKFGGLPKVIITAADRMHRQDLLLDLFRNDNNLVPVLEADRTLDDLFAWLPSYFRSCPDFLRPCIFYLPIFPLNHAIRRRRLVRRWIAEAYSRDTKEYTAEENGEIFFSRLTNLSMIQVRAETTSRTSHVDNSKRIPLCQVNGFLREYITSQSMEENLVFALDAHCRKNLQRTERHLAIYESWERDKKMFERVDFSRLRSLTVFGEWKGFFISEMMRLLRVLDLEDVSSGVTNGDVEQMVKMLPRLKFLSLRGCRELNQLPDSFGDLKHLQTLDIRETSVTKLPKSIINLDKLQYIRAGTTTHHQAKEAADQSPAQSAASMRRPYATLVSCLSKLSRHSRLNGGGAYHSGVKVPRGIGRLFDMHTLGVADIEVAGGDAILEELKKLTQLRKLGVSGVNQNHVQKFFTAISDLAHLESLALGLQLKDNDEAGCLDDIISPPVNLRSLKLYGLVHKFPVWIKKLKKLRKLSLQMTMLPQEGIDDLASSLQELENIRLFLSEFQDDELHFGRQETIFLGLLEISCNTRVQAKITFHDQFYLKVLRIRSCHLSSLQFSGLDSLKALKEVWLCSHYDDSLKQHLESELAKRSPEEVVKPVLRLQKPGSWIPWLLTSS